eukprot:3705052-Rhodomonas_salina.1
MHVAAMVRVLFFISQWSRCVPSRVQGYHDAAERAAFPRLGLRCTRVSLTALGGSGREQEHTKLWGVGEAQ